MGDFRSSIVLLWVESIPGDKHNFLENEVLSYHNLVEMILLVRPSQFTNTLQFWLLGRFSQTDMDLEFFLFSLKSYLLENTAVVKVHERCAGQLEIVESECSL